MSPTLSLTLHGTWLTIESDQEAFLEYAAQHLAGWLASPTDRPDVRVRLHWNKDLMPALTHDGRYYRLGRRLLLSDNEIIQPEMLALPGLQLHSRLSAEGLAIDAAFIAPSRRLKLGLGGHADRERIYATLIYYLVYFPLLWHIERSRRWFPLHASAVAWPQGALILSGLGGVGKSTLTLAFLDDPAAHLLSENLILHDETWVYAFPEPIHLDARSRELLSHLNGRLQLTGQVYSHGRQSYQVPASARVQSAKPRLFCLLRQGKELSLRPVPTAEAVEIVLSSDTLAKEVNEYAQQAAALNLLSPQAGQLERRVKALQKLLQGVTCYELTVRPGDPLERATAAVRGRLGW